MKYRISLQKKKNNQKRIVVLQIINGKTSNPKVYPVFYFFEYNIDQLTRASLEHDSSAKRHPSPVACLPKVKSLSCSILMSIYSKFITKCIEFQKNSIHH